MARNVGSTPMPGDCSDVSFLVSFSKRSSSICFFLVLLATTGTPAIPSALAVSPVMECDPVGETPLLEEPLDLPPLLSLDLASIQLR